MSRGLVTITCACGRRTEHWCEHIDTMQRLWKEPGVNSEGERFESVQGLLDVIRHEALERVVMAMVDLMRNIEEEDDPQIVFYTPSGERELTHHEVYIKALNMAQEVVEIAMASYSER